MALYAWRARPSGVALGVAIFTGMPGSAEKDFQCDLPVLPSTTRLAQPDHQAPAAVTVIDGAMMAAGPAPELTDLLCPAPGFRAGSPTWAASVA